jgi:hypothetical protein
VKVARKIAGETDTCSESEATRLPEVPSELENKTGNSPILIYDIMIFSSNTSVIQCEYDISCPETY